MTKTQILVQAGILIAYQNNFVSPEPRATPNYFYIILTYAYVTFFIFFMLGHIVFDMGDQGFDIGIHPFSRVNKLMLFDFSFQRQKFPPSNSRFSVFSFSSFSLWI